MKMNERVRQQSVNLPSYKLILIGNGGVGKSAITIQFIKNHFVLEYDPTIEDSYTRQIYIDNELVRLSILDTAGQQEFRAMRDQYLRTGDGFLLVFSVCDKYSFDEIQKFQKQILRSKDVDSFPMLMVGNKCDLEGKREVTTEEIEKISKELNIPFLESSAKSKTNIEKIFTDLVFLIREFQLKERPPVPPIKKKQSRCLII